jgi:hypothetical protein
MYLHRYGGLTDSLLNLDMRGLWGYNRRRAKDNQENNHTS